MNTRKIRGIDYIELENGALLPASYVREPVRMRTPKDILPLLLEERTADQERIVVFTLDGSNQVIKKHTVTIGLVNQSQVHPREVFRQAISDNACVILVAHNHPSGNCEPSEGDLAATRRLVESGKTLGIPVLDHVIVGREAFQSIRERYPAYFV